MLVSVVLGITYGAGVGLFNNYLLLSGIRRARVRGQEALKATGKLFALRYLLDVAALLAVALLVGDIAMLIAAAVGITILGNIALYRVYVRRGGTFE